MSNRRIIRQGKLVAVRPAIGGEGSGQTAPLAAAAEAPSMSFAAPSAAALLLSAKEAAAFLGVSERRFHELRSESWMPAPIGLSQRFLRWSRCELEAAVANMPRAKKRNEPAQLARARAEKSAPAVSL